MTNEQNEQQRYSLSTLGRAIYCFIALVVGPFGLLAIFLWWHDSQYMSVFLRTFALPFGLAMVYMAVYWLLRAFAPGLRFIIQGNGFTYYGLFSTIHINWDAIESFKLSYSRLGTVLMHLRLKQGVWPRNRKVLDLSGLRPSFRQLIGDFEYHLKNSPNSAIKRDAAIRNRSTTAFPFRPALMAIDFAALIAIGLCVAELFPKHGKPLGLIPSNWVWPILLVSIVVAAICGFFQVRILLSRNKSARAKVAQPHLK